MLKSDTAYFLLLQLFFGINFGFIPCFRKNIQKIVYCVEIILILITTAILSIPVYIMFPSSGSFWFATNVLQYLLNSIILNFTKYNVYNFITSINQIDSNIPELNKEILGLFLFIYSGLLFVPTFIVGYHFCETVISKTCARIYPTSYLFYSVLAMNLNLISVVIALVNYNIYCVTKNLNGIISNTNVSLKNIQNYYTGLLDSYDKIKPLYDRLMMTMLCFDYPKMLGIVWFLTANFITSELKSDWFIYLFGFIAIAHSVLRFTVSSIIVEMIKFQIQESKQTLTLRMLDEEDAKKISKLQVLLQYMEQRRLELRVWHVIPIGIQLPLSVLSSCVTYIIVIMQFTHIL